MLLIFEKPKVVMNPSGIGSIGDIGTIGDIGSVILRDGGIGSQDTSTPCQQARRAHRPTAPPAPKVAL